MSKSWMFVVGVAACLAGCASYKQTVQLPQGSFETGNQASATALTLVGPQGSVAIGDDLAKAKAAFPPSKGAQVYDNSLAFAILGGKGWAWTMGSDGYAFEVALDKGKIKGFAVTEIGKPPTQEMIEKTVADLGAPTRRAKGKTVEAVVWEVGENARFMMFLKTDPGPLGAGTLTLIGRKSDLAMLSYRADDPETMVKIMHAGAEQMRKR